jgi:hypothetical protein
MASRSFGTDGLISEAGVSCAFMTLITVAGGVSAANGLRPVSSS